VGWDIGPGRFYTLPIWNGRIQSSVCRMGNPAHTDSPGCLGSRSRGVLLRQHRMQIAGQEVCCPRPPNERAMRDTKADLCLLGRTAHGEIGPGCVRATRILLPPAAGLAPLPPAFISRPHPDQPSCDFSL
jgi:hypothetical protein